MIRCPQCQAELEEGKRFCPQCGARLTEPTGDAGKTTVTPPEPPGDIGRTVLLPPEGDADKTMVTPPEPPGDVGRTVLLPPEGDAGKTTVTPPQPPGDVGRTVLLPPEGDAGKTTVTPPQPPGDVGRTVLLPPEGDAGKTMVIPPQPPSSGAPSSSAGLQTILEDPARRQSSPPDVALASSGGGFGLPPAAPPTTPSTGDGFGVPPSTPPPAGGGFGLPPAAPPTTPSTGGGFGVPPSTPPPAGGGAGRLPSVPSSAVGGASGAPAATTTAKKGPNWLLIIGIILGVLVLACVLILGSLYWIGQQAAQSLGTAVAVTAVSIGEPPASTDFPNVLLRDSLASEATSQFTAGQTESGDYRFENGAFVIESLDTDQIVWQTIDEVVDDASFEIEATVDKPRSAAIALLFRYQDNQNFYILSIDGRGRYRVARYVNDEFSVLSDWKTSPAINAAGSSNRLRIDMAGDALTFFCNGQRLTSLRDSAFRSGNLAFGTETFDEGQGVVRFTNLVVRGR
jgi:hypothetical protein